MPGTEKSHAALLNELALLDPTERREVAKKLARMTKRPKPTGAG
jgi:hypothetical protein